MPDGPVWNSLETNQGLWTKHRPENKQAPKVTSPLETQSSESEQLSAEELELLEVEAELAESNEGASGTGSAWKRFGILVQGFKVLKHCFDHALGS